MVTIERNGQRLTLKPNASASWQHVRRVLIGLGILTSAIAIFWAFMGAWVILPFAGLEIALLSYFVYRSSVNSYQQQQLSINDEGTLVFEAGYKQPTRHIECDQNTAEFTITHATHSLSSPSITLHANQAQYAIGQFLVREECESLIQWIKNQGFCYQYQGQTHTVASDYWQKKLQ